MGASVIRVVFPKEEEILVCPSVVALECSGGGILSFGDEARLTTKRMPGSADLVYPLLEPEHLPFNVLEGLFGCAAALGNRSGRFRTDLVLSVPASVSEELEGAFPEAASALGAKDVYMINGLHAAARSIEHAFNGHTAVIHIGASTTEIGIFVEGDCLISRTLRIGGHTYDDLLGDFIYDRFDLLLDGDGAEDLKNRLSDLPKEEHTIGAYGIQKRTGLPQNMELDADELRGVLLSAYGYITEALSEMMAQTGESPKMVALTGGCAPICGLCETIADALPEAEVTIVSDPADAVIRGLCEMIAAGEI